MSADNVLIWIQEAGLCRTEGTPSDFFPDPAMGAQSKPYRDALGRAKEICMRCPLRAPCLEYAMLDPYSPGVWGGTSEAQRTAQRVADRRLGSPRLHTKHRLHTTRPQETV